MFTTANGFHLALTIQPVNSPTTFLSRTTLSSWCNSLPVFLTVLVMNPTYLIFSLLLILLLILLDSFLLWVHPITFLSLCLVLSLQVFRKNGPRLRRGDVSGILVPLTGLTCGCTFLIFHGMITVSVRGVTLSVQSANLGLILLVLMLSTAGMLPLGITVVFKLQKLTPLIFHPGIVQNLFFEMPKTLFSVENAIIFLAFF